MIGQCPTCGSPLAQGDCLNCKYGLADKVATTQTAFQTSGLPPPISASTIQQPPTPPQAKRSPVLGAIITLGIFVFVLFYFLSGGVENKVANDAVEQYRIAVRNGTTMDRCVQAGMVSAAYLQAKDEAKYREWKETEEADCRAAGVPQ